MKTVSIKISEDLHKKFKVKTTLEEISIQNCGEQLIHDYVYSKTRNTKNNNAEE